MNSEALTLFSFEQKAAYWNDLYAHPGSLFEHLMVRRRDHAADYIAAHFPRDTRILDLGCGAGVLSERLIQRGFCVTAADASADMLALTRERLRGLPEERYRLFEANCLRLPFADGEFDLVASLGMFGYFDEVSLALAEIRRVLRPGGTLLLSVRNAYTPQVFDPARLARLPLRALREVLRRRRGRQVEPAMPSAAADDGFRIAIYQRPQALIEGVNRRGYTLTHFDGLGYGPLCWQQRKLFSEARSIRVSEVLERSLRATGLQRYGRWVADVSFYVFRRDA